MSDKPLFPGTAFRAPSYDGKPLPPDQRYEVLHPMLGPWVQGAVIQGDADLVNCDVAQLLELRAIQPTDAPHSPEKRDG